MRLASASGGFFKKSTRNRSPAMTHNRRPDVFRSFQQSECRTRLKSPQCQAITLLGLAMGLLSSGVSRLLAAPLPPAQGTVTQVLTATVIEDFALNFRGEALLSVFQPGNRSLLRWDSLFLSGTTVPILDSKILLPFPHGIRHRFEAPGPKLHDLESPILLSVN